MISYNQALISDLRFQARYYAFEGNYNEVRHCLFAIYHLLRES